MKKALIFDPYLDTLGGGERYTLTFAICLSKQGYDVELAWKDSNTLGLAESRFGLDLSKLAINPVAADKFTDKTSLFEKYKFTKKYDLIFFVSDGSLPFLFSRNNLVHFQVPFKQIGGSNILNKIKTLFIHKFVYNSLFTQNVHESHFPKNKGVVLYPPISVNDFSPAKKKNQIISVARFGSPSHSKRQDVLIEAFRQFVKINPSYSLLLTGGLVGDKSNIESLQKLANGLPVKIITTPSFAELKEYYSESKIFWHAAGYDVDERLNPEKVEHFGMTTVEAMASGCVPVVIAKGGQKEIIIDGTGKLVDDIDGLVEQTEKIIQNDKLMSSMSQLGISRSKDFSIEKFNETINAML